MNILQNISMSVQAGNTGQTEILVTKALEKNNTAGILREGLIAGMMEIQKKFRRNEILDSEVVIAEQAMNAGLQALMLMLNKTQSSTIGTVITGTLEGDIREIEKNIISVMMRSLGLRVADLGASVSCARFIEGAIEEKAHIIACTTTMTTFLPQMKSLVQAAIQVNIRGKTKILLSGAPVTEWFCKGIEADMYAPDMIQAAELAAEYCRKTVKKIMGSRE